MTSDPCATDQPVSHCKVGRVSGVENGVLSSEVLAHGQHSSRLDSGGTSHCRSRGSLEFAHGAE